MEGDIIDISPFFVDNCYMEPKTSIKQHDFISGEPRHKYFVLGDYDFSNIRINPLQLQDWQETILSKGLQQGELGIIMSPPGVGKSMIMERMLASINENRQVVNTDYDSLYPEMTRYLGLTLEDIIENNNLR